MNRMKKMLVAMASQIKNPSVTLPTSDKPHKIKDDNQSIHNGVINEKSESSVRGAGKTVAKRKRKPSAERAA